MRAILVATLALSWCPALADPLAPLLGPPRYAECLPGIDLEGIDVAAPAASGESAPPKRIALLLDSSGSMAGRVGRESKMELARREARALLERLPQGIDATLIAFGHRGDNDEAGRAESCAGVETLVTGAARGDLATRIGQARATGWTPLAAALAHAATAFEDGAAAGEQVVWVVSDGEETCGGDPVAAARALREGGMRVVVNIVGMDLPPGDRAALMAVAEAGGGTFVEAGPGQAGIAEVILDASLRGKAAVRGVTADTRNVLKRTVSSSEGGVCINRLLSRERIAMTRLGVDRSVPADDKAALAKRFDARAKAAAAVGRAYDAWQRERTDAKRAEIEAAWAALEAQLAR